MVERMGPTLRIVCINDVYTLENLPRFASLVRACKSVAPADRMLVTLAGDFVAPSLLSGLDAGRGMVDCLNLLGVTHVCFGNHEDDIPTEELHRRIAEFRGIWLSTNLRQFDDKLVPSEVVQIGRVRLGLIGVVMDDRTAYRRPPFGGTALLAPEEAALAEAARLVRDQGCACVIPLTHQSIADDRALAGAQAAISPARAQNGFPLIIGGHEHTAFLEQAAGTWIVKAGADAVEAVIVERRWPAIAPAAGPDLPSVQVRLEPVAGYAEDAAVRARVDQHMAKVHALERATLMRLAPGERLSSVGARRQQTSLGTLICSRIRDVLSAEACLINGGGLRGSRDYEHHMTYADVKTELPFENALVVARLPGAVIRAAIAASRARAPAESGGYLQVDDRMRVDPGNQLIEIAGQPLDPAREYRVALVRDLFSGMDHQEPLLQFAQAHPERIPPADSALEIKHVLVAAFSRALWSRLGGFEQVDLNHDGVVTEEELAQAVARAIGEPPSPLAATLLMDALEGHGAHTLSRNEADQLERAPAADPLTK